MDLMYDKDYDGSGAHGFLTMDCDEDSVDIYSGLGDTPTHATETPSMLFSPRVKESMDLYEEIITEEVKSKDSSYEELKARFLAAQSQIEELRKRLAQTETQNTGLSTENLRLKKNISALLKTARQEVLRKDQEIKNLNQRSGVNTYNPRANGQWRTFPNNHENTPPPLLPLPQPGPGNASSTIAPTSRTPATPPYPPPPQHRPSRTSSTSSTTCTPQPRRTSLTNSTPKSAATPPNPPPPQHRPSRSSSTCRPPATPPNPPPPQHRPSRSSSACRPPAPPAETALPFLPQPQPSKTPSSLSTTCKPSPLPTNPPPPKHGPSRTSSTSSISCRPPAPPKESPLPSPSQPGLSKKSSSISSTSTPSAPPTNPLPPKHRLSRTSSTSISSTSTPSAPPTNPPLPSSLPLPQPIRTSSKMSTSKEPSPPPPPPPVEPPPPPPPPPPVHQPRPPSPPSEDVCPESLPPPPPQEKVRDGAAQRPDTTCLETSKSKQPNTLPKCSSRLDSEAMDKKQEVESQSLGKSSSELPPELGKLDTLKPLKHKEQEPKSQMQLEATDKRLKSSLELNKDCDTNHRNRSHRAEKDSRKKHISRSQDTEEHHSSERVSRSLDRKQDKAKPAVSESNDAEPKESRLRDSGREHRKDKRADRTSEKKQSSSTKERRNSTTKQHADGNVETSKRKGDRADPSGEDRRKTERRREDENGRWEKRSEKHRKRSKDEGRRKAESREGEKKSIKDLEKLLEEEHNVPARMECLKENSPNRKLCFMETLNLTLSPVKKPQTQKDCVPQEVTQADGGDEEKDGEIGSKDDDQPNLEEFLIIDEIESSMNEMEIDHDKEQSTKPSSASQTSTDEKCAIEEVEKDQSLTTSQTRVVVSEQPEVLPVPTTSECDLPEAKESINVDRPSPKESIIISKLPVENTKCPSPNNPVAMEELETLNPCDDEMGSISEDGKCSPSQNNNPENLSEPIVLQSGIKTLEHELHESPATAPGDKEKLSSPCPITSSVVDEVKETVSSLSPITSPVADEVKETVSSPCPITSPVADEVIETVSGPCPITSPVADEVEEAVSGSYPITSPVSEEVNKTTSSPCPITSPVSEEVNKTTSSPCPITSPVSGEVNKTLSRLSPIASPVSEEVNKTTSSPCPITRPVSEKVNKTMSSPCPITCPVSGEVNEMVSSRCPITSPVSGEVNKKDSPEGLQSPPNDHLKPPGPASMLGPTHEGDVDHQESSKCWDTVSSTITLEALPQGVISLPEAIYVLTHTDDSSSNGTSPNEPSSSVSCVGVSKVSSTTEDMTSPGKLESVQECTPVKGYGAGDCHQPRRSMEKDEASTEPSSSVPLFYDEDSMMLMLKNLRSIPDVISPLRSPMLRTKRVLTHCTTTKPPHVKSLQKDFCSTAVISNSMKLNLNKETKYPDNPLTQEPQPVMETDLTRLPIRSDGVSASSSELEEGEILSDSNEATADISPPKRSKFTRSANNNKNNKPSPESISQTAKRSSKESSSNGASETLSPSTASPSSGKSRFKKVCTVGEQTPLITIEEVMETLKKVRFQIRKKYMKLHKVFPKKSFYAMMDHFQQSFLEFVESAIFDEISSQVSELKARLRKLVMSVFSKVMNNGIVNRIFDLQATNLKQRLWDFVDVQLNHLFMDIQLALKTLCKPTVPHDVAKTEQKVVNPGKNWKIHKKLTINTSPKKTRSPKEKRPVQTFQRRIKPCPVVPSKTGLGRGKDIRIICMERQNADPEPNPSGAGFPPRSIPLTPEKSHRTSLLISHNSTTQDRSDFEILTEQQASSLTFNLVRDTQMGEIFKCLMQGSDLLDASVAAGDATSWSLSTPRKECLPGDSLLSITSPSKFLSPSKFTSPGKFVTPTKFITSPSKLITTWSSISPSKSCSPQPKLLHMPLNPAMFDESCLLELPSSSRGTTQRSYSLLAEDLAVSLTIPSPLKSDSHLSFLQPRALDTMSTPESVISAHFGEDALLDGEDAWEQQDLHLALDTDNSNSSRCSSTTSTTTGDALDPGLFQFKPHLPMQAVVMERSNDHFIVKIRQSAVEAADVTLTADDSLSRTLMEEDQYQGEMEPHMLEPHTAERVPRAMFLEKSFGKEPSPLKPSPPPPEETIPAVPESSQAKTKTKTSVKELPSQPLESPSSMDETEISTASEGRLAIVEDASSGSTPRKEAMDKVCRKRKIHQGKSKAKRAKKEEERGGKKRKKAAMASPKCREPRSSKQDKSEGTESPPKTPPSSLSAKNVVKKKGEVVVAWTRDEDRAILLGLKTKGASRETFSVLSEKLNKSSAQIAERFSQLMKLFKKQEKRDNSSP